MLSYKSALIFVGVILTGCTNTVTKNIELCDVSALDQSAIDEARQDKFQTIPQASFEDLATSLATCLGHPDPAIRDDLAYGTLTAMLRSGSASPNYVRALRDMLFAQLDAPDPDGFTHPFVALVLAEISRVDRVSPYLSDSERNVMVSRAANFLSSERDYRGFSDEHGWRHGIAHGADWLMQLALNPALSDESRNQIYRAVTSQIQATDGHAYIFGEPERLARPYLFAALQDIVGEEVWNERLSQISDPAPMSDWSEAFNSEAGLARLHNLKAFLRVLLIHVMTSENPSLKAMEPAIITSIRMLPA